MMLFPCMLCHAVPEHAAEAKLEGRPRELLKTAQLDLRKSLTSVVGRVRDDDYPSYQCIDLRLEQLEEGELRAERLDEVTSYQLELRSGMRILQGTSRARAV